MTTKEESSLSDEISATTVLPRPSNLSETKNNGEIDLSWTNNDNSANGGIDVERSTDGSTWSTIASGLSTSTNSYTDTSVSGGTSYNYRIERNTNHATAISGADFTVISVEESPLSTEVSATTALPPPTNLSVSNIKKDSANLSWISNADNGTQRVYKQNDDAGTDPVDASGSLPLSTESYTIGSLKSDTQYTVSIKVETDHAVSEDISFDVGPDETIQVDSHYVVSDTKEVAGTLQVLNYK
jgi:hypothetical protein